MADDISVDSLSDFEMDDNKDYYDDENRDGRDLESDDDQDDQIDDQDDRDDDQDDDQDGQDDQDDDQIDDQDDQDDDQDDQIDDQIDDQNDQDDKSRNKISDNEQLNTDIYSDDIDTQTIKNNINIISDKKNYRSRPWLSIYEYTKILSERTNQILSGAKIMLNISNTPDVNNMSSIEIAKYYAIMELKHKVSPFKIIRKIGNNTIEIWDVNDLELLWKNENEIMNI